MDESQDAEPAMAENAHELARTGASQHLVGIYSGLINSRTTELGYTLSIGDSEVGVCWCISIIGCHSEFMFSIVWPIQS